VSDAVDDAMTPRPKPAEIAARIENDIALGRLGAGAWLKQIDLEQRYNCTRIDLRQALDRLVERGLVRRIANRGYQVEEHDPRRMDEIRRVRAILEVAAAESYVERIDAAALDELTALAQRFADAVDHETIDVQESTNHAFHERMLRHCDNRELVALIFDLRHRVPIAVTRARNTRALMLRAARDHFEMIELLRARDVAGLGELLHRHVIADMADVAGEDAARCG
jgi:DNA-binding GntR family transcriptional regulator